MDFKHFLRPGKGSTDITPLLADKTAFRELVTSLSNLFKNEVFDKLVCIEGRGFLLGSAVAFNLNLGIVPVRYPGKLKNATYSASFIDYSGQEKTLEIHTDNLKPGEKVLIVDDWIETGETVKATINLIEKCGSEVTGIGAFMDDSTEDLKNSLKKYNYKYLEMVNKNDKF